MTTVAITMGGNGSRFLQAGFQEPKYLIKVRGKSLLEWSLMSLLDFIDEGIVFVLREEHKSEEVVEQTARKLGFSKIEFVHILGVTDGQATTALLAGKKLQLTDEPFAIYNIDTFVEPPLLSPSKIRGIGWIPVFSAPGLHWSFVTIDQRFRVSAIEEKVRLSDLATVGFYYFDSFSRFQWAYKNTSFEPYKEKYVAPLYKSLLQEEIYAEILPSQHVHVLGTPEEAKRFEQLRDEGLMASKLPYSLTE